MKKVLLIPIAVTALLVSCKSKSSATSNTASKPTTTSTVSAEALAQGKTLFESSCAKCHDLPNPANYTDEKWVGIMNWMAPKAKLSADQSTLVYNYVTSKN